MKTVYFGKKFGDVSTGKVRKYRTNARVNPFSKFLRPEDKVQKAILDFVRLQYPEALWIHVPNEGRRTKFEMYLMKLLGARSGASDLVFFEPRGKYHGLLMEVKSEKGRLTDNQKMFLAAAYEREYLTCVVYTAEEGIKVVRDYMEL